MNIQRTPPFLQKGRRKLIKYIRKEKKERKQRKRVKKIRGFDQEVQFIMSSVRENREKMRIRDIPKLIQDSFFF